MPGKRSVDYLARRLYEAGCRYAFGMPGGEVLTLVDALVSAGIQFILAKHENAAGFMAEGTYHCTGAPGILVATIGPGLANGINVVANAQQDRVPLIVLSGCVDDDEALTYTHQVFDHQALVRPITKATFKLTAHSADLIADRAVAAALDDRPGPVHIDVPISIAEIEVDLGVLTRRAPNSPVAPATGEDWRQAIGWLEEAQRPLVVAGLDVMNHNAGDALRDLIEHIDAPLITTYKAKGVVSEEHPLCLGAAGLSPLADDHLLPLVHAADVIIAAGYDPIEMRSGWRHPWVQGRQKIIEFSAVANDHYMHHADLSFVCDVKSALQSVIAAVPRRVGWPDRQPTQVKQSLAITFSAGDEWGPAAVIASALDALPADTLACVDSGAHRILLSQMWTCTRPRSLIQSTGLCTMGCALPLAIGAKTAEPDRTVVAFTGDAGLLMVLGELGTAAELRCPIIVVVFVDASLALIEMKQRGRQLTNEGVDFDHFDFAAIARAMGGEGISVRSSEGLSAALTKATRADSFTVIACELSRQSYDGKF